MAHFAKLDSDNQVEQVVVIDNNETKDVQGVETESIGIARCQQLFGADTTWKQTSYNANGEGLRGNFAGIGMSYMSNVATLGVGSTDIFIGISTNASWTVGIKTALYYPPDNPGPAPEVTDSERAAGKRYEWNESNYNTNPSTAWVLIP